LVRKERPEITKIVSCWGSSDRSENADYHYNKRKYVKLTAEIRYLTKLEVAHKVNSPEQDGKAYFGAWVELENDEGETIKFRIVGDEEIYRKTIFPFNPIARACLGKSIGDEVKVQTPKGINEWYIIKIEYLDGNP
jgi:transcription elongation factor GreB